MHAARRLGSALYNPLPPLPVLSLTHPPKGELDKPEF